MKADIHPEYQTVIFLDTSCDHKTLSRSTLSSEETMEWEDGNSYPVIRVEISAASHPFYTGKKQLIMDRGGRIEQFNRRYGTASEAPAGAGEEAAAEGGEEATEAAQA